VAFCTVSTTRLVPRSRYVLAGNKHTVPNIMYTHYTELHNYNRFMALLDFVQDFVQDYPGEPVPGR